MANIKLKTCQIIRSSAKQREDLWVIIDTTGEASQHNKINFSRSTVVKVSLKIR